MAHMRETHVFMVAYRMAVQAHAIEGDARRAAANRDGSVGRSGWKAAEPAVKEARLLRQTVRLCCSAAAVT